MIINLINIVRLSSHQQIRDEEHVWRGDGKRGRDSEKVERVGGNGKWQTTKNPPKRVFSILAEALAQRGEGAPA